MTIPLTFHMLIMDDQSSNLRACYRILEDKVINTLHTCVGDRQRIGVVRDEAIAFMAVIGQVRHRLQKKKILTFAHVNS